MVQVLCWEVRMVFMHNSAKFAQFLRLSTVLHIESILQPLIVFQKQVSLLMLIRYWEIFITFITKAQKSTNNLRILVMSAKHKLNYFSYPELQSGYQDSDLRKSSLVKFNRLFMTFASIQEMMKKLRICWIM